LAATAALKLSVAWDGNGHNKKTDRVNPNPLARVRRNFSLFVQKTEKCFMMDIASTLSSLNRMMKYYI